MEGRDPHEPHRTATPLELLFDLTFVVAFGIAADELAHYVVEDHIKAGLLGFALATFSIIWAWINFSWFASAYDTDDWVYRLTTMVQMVGVIVLALGLPAMFESIDEGHTVDNRVMVAGYIVMRVAMVFQWERAARQDPPRKRVCRTYIDDDRGRPGGLARAARWPRRRSSSRSRGWWCWSSSSSRARGSRRPAWAGRPGTRTTSPSATACS